MRNVVLTAIREYKATAMTKAFIFGVVVFPAVVGVIIWVVVALNLFAEKERALEGTIAIADGTTSQVVAEEIVRRLSPEEQQKRAEAQAEQIQEAMEQSPGADAIPETQREAAQKMAERVLVGPVANLEFEVLEPESVDSEALQQRVRDGELAAFLDIPPDIMTAEDGGQYELFVGEDMDRKLSERIRDATESAVVQERIEAEGLEPGRVFALVNRPTAATRTVTAEGARASQEWTQIVVPLVFIGLLMTAVFTGGQYLLMSTIEEKSSRVMEVILSAVTPMQLMTGKIIGQGFVGLTVLVIYGGLGLVAAVQFGHLGIIPVDLLPLLVIYFLLAYFMIASLFAAAGSAVTEMREANSLLGPLWLVIIVPIYMVFFNIDNPNSAFMRGASYFPPATPFVMPVRLSQPGAQVPAWEVAVTMLLCLAMVIFTVWIAAKIFRVGILMYGKPPTFMGLLKWIRYS